MDEALFDKYFSVTLWLNATMSLVLSYPDRLKQISDCLAHHASLHGGSLICVFVFWQQCRFEKLILLNFLMIKYIIKVTQKKKNEKSFQIRRPVVLKDKIVSVRFF